MGIGPLILVALAGWINRQQQDLIEYLRGEVRVLKELQGQKCLRFSDDQRRRLALKAKRLGLSRLKEIAAIVSPQTLMVWHRKLIAGKYDSSYYPRRVGRPPTAEHLRGLVLRMAEENRGWGYSRIQGALANLGHNIGRGTIAGILKGAGAEPAPERGKRTTWAEFLRVHWEVLAAADFFTVELWSWGRLTRYHVLFVIRLATRSVQIAGIIPEPDGKWMRQVGRTDGVSAGVQVPDPRPCDSVYPGIRIDPQVCWRGVNPPSRAVSESERIRRKVRADDQIRVPSPSDSRGRTLSPAGGRRVLLPLP